MRKWKSLRLGRGRHLGLAALAVFNERCVCQCVQNDVKNTHFAAGVRLFFGKFGLFGWPYPLKMVCLRVKTWFFKIMVRTGLWLRLWLRLRFGIWLGEAPAYGSPYEGGYTNLWVRVRTRVCKRIKTFIHHWCSTLKITKECIV